MTETTIFCFRQDLRIDDNPGLIAAADRGDVVAVYILDETQSSDWSMGGATRWWLHHSLESLAKSLEMLGIDLVLRRGPYLEQLTQIITETKASAVYWNRRYEPQSIAIDKSIKLHFESQGMICKSFNALLLREPWETLSKTNEPYQVFTPFWRARLVQGAMAEKPKDAPKRINAAATKIRSDDLSEWKLLPKIPWDSQFYQHWKPGEANAHARLSEFNAAKYGELRNRPDIDGVSRMSPYLHFGEISVRRIWEIIAKNPGEKAAEPFLRELGWREFAYYLLFHFPETPNQALKKNFEHLEWSKDEKNPNYIKWCLGMTGYPIVDAGMRELWQTGWMHNRVRMIVASFLVKDLMVDWRLGARWFWDTLVDADLASNTLGWQWASGCGADAAPFFRVFNPMLQGEKFDPDGVYVRHYIPEIRALDNSVIHRPWEASPLERRTLGIETGAVPYPDRIVDHDEARNRALFAYEKIKKK